MLQEFKTFIAKGNVMELAVAVIIGAAFGKIVESVVKDIITPVIGMLGGQPDFSGIKLGSVMVGNFLNAVVAFLILAAVVFFVFVKPMNRLKAMTEKPKAPEAPVAPTAQEQLLAEIRDLLKQRQVRLLRHRRRRELSWLRLSPHRIQDRADGDGDDQNSDQDGHELGHYEPWTGVADAA